MSGRARASAREQQPVHDVQLDEPLALLDGASKVLAGQIDHRGLDGGAGEEERKGDEDGLGVHGGDEEDDEAAVWAAEGEEGKEEQRRGKQQRRGTVAHHELGGTLKAFLLSIPSVHPHSFVHSFVLSTSPHQSCLAGNAVRAV